MITIVACALVMWLRANQTNSPAVDANSRKLQFGLRAIFAAMTLTAIVIAIAPLLDAPRANGFVVAVALVIVGWSFAYGWQVRSRIGAVLATSFLPFTWMIAFNRPFGGTSGLAVNIPIGPGVLYAELIRGVAGLNRDDVEKVAAVIVFVQLLIGAWLARRGGRLSTIYTVLVFVSSSLRSLVLHALYRA